MTAVSYLPPVPPRQELVQAPQTLPRLVELDRCRPMLERVLTETPWDDLCEEIASGRAQLWPGKEAVMVTRVIGDTLEVWLGAGELQELLSLEPGVVAFGRSMGCTRVTIEGRQGWGKVLKSNGWAVSFVKYARPL